MSYLGDLALREGDHLLGQVFYSLNEDCKWHRDWSQALTRMVIEDNPLNRRTIQAWIENWYPVAASAVRNKSVFSQRLSLSVSHGIKVFLKTKSPIESPGRGG